MLSCNTIVANSPSVVKSQVQAQGVGLVYKHIFQHRWRGRVMPRDIVVRRPALPCRAKGGGRRGRITRLTPASRRRMLLAARNAGKWRVMLTLTYPGEFPSSGRTVKRHLNAFLVWLRRRGVRRYFWWLEFQERGAPHIHVLLDGPVGKDAVARVWYRVVGSGDERHLKAGTRIEWLRSSDAAIGYVCVYANKVVQKHVPEHFQDVGRFWGCSRFCVDCVLMDVQEVRVLRRYVQHQIRVWYGSRWNARGGFVCWNGPPILQRLRSAKEKNWSTATVGDGGG